MNNIGQRLAAEIERLGGISAVAKRLGAVRNTLYNWIERENIPLGQLMQLRDAGADVLYIITGATSPESLNSDEQVLIQLYRALPPSARAAAIGSIAGISVKVADQSGSQVISGTVLGDVANGNITKG